MQGTQEQEPEKGGMPTGEMGASGPESRMTASATSAMSPLDQPSTHEMPSRGAGVGNGSAHPDANGTLAEMPGGGMAAEVEELVGPSACWSSFGCRRESALPRRSRWPATVASRASSWTLHTTPFRSAVTQTQGRHPLPPTSRSSSSVGPSSRTSEPSWKRSPT